MTHATVRQATYDIRRLHTIGACSLLVVLCGAYVYLLCMSVVHVVMHKEVRSEIATLHSSIGQLESEYIKRQHAVSDEIALQHGYVAITEKVFLDRTEDNLVFSSRP